MENKPVAPLVYSFILLGQTAIKLKSLIPFTTNMQEAVGLVLESLFVFGNMYDEYLEDNVELSNEEKDWLREYRNEVLMNWFGPVGVSKVPPKLLKDRLGEYHKVKESYFSELMNSLQPEAANLIQERIAEFTKMQQANMEVQQAAAKAAAEASGQNVDPEKLEIAEDNNEPKVEPEKKEE